MQTSNHILSQEGILTTFLIGKKITTKDIKKIRNKLKNSKISNKKIDEILATEIAKDTRKKINIKEIPGLIIDEVEQSEEKKRIMELTYFASMISKKLSEKNIDKYYSCFIINAIVNMIGLTEENFNDFHKRFSEFKDKENGNIDSNKDDTDTEDGDGYIE